MATILREITVDVAQYNRFAAIVAKQYDKESRFLKVHLTNMEQPITVDPQAMVVINARRPDGVAKSFEGTINQDGSVTVPLTQWMLALDGAVKCDISIISGTEVMLTSTLFELDVQEAAADEEAMEQDEDYGVLINLIETVSDLEDTADGLVDDLNNLKTAYESQVDKIYNIDGTKLYISNTQPTGDIAVGSVGIGW